MRVSVSRQRRRSASRPQFGANKRAASCAVAHVGAVLSLTAPQRALTLQAMARSMFTARHSLRRLVLVALVLVILGALIYRSSEAIGLKGFSWGRLGQSMRGARGSLLLLSVATIFVSYALRALRWMRFSRYLGRTTFQNVYSSTLIGFAAIFLLGRAGEPVRPLLIARSERLPISGMFGIYVLERVFDTASTAVLAGWGLVVVPRLSSEQFPASAVLAARTTGLALFAGLLAAIILLVYLRLHGASALERRLAGWRAATGWKRRLAGLFAGFSDGLQAIRTWSDLFAGVTYSAAHWATVALIYLWIAHSFGGRLAQLDFSDAMLVLAVTMVGSTLQLPGVGGGSQLASFLAFTGIFGVEKEPAAAASIVLWLVTFATSSLAGVPLLIHEGWSMNELRHLAQAEAESEAAGPHAANPDVPRIPQGNTMKTGNGPR